MIERCELYKYRKQKKSPKIETISIVNNIIVSI